MLVLGIDPGAKGAVALYDSESRRLLFAHNFRQSTEIVNGKARARVDWVELDKDMELASSLGCSFAGIEKVNGVIGQSASASFTFGFTTCIAHAAARYAGMSIRTVMPTVWKAKLSVPGKGKLSEREYTEAIVSRADALFPNDVDKFRGKKGGKLLDVAEAAMIAYYFSLV